MEERITLILKDSLAVQEATITKNYAQVIQAINVITEAFKKGRKLILFGNGGSAADSQHIAAEFIGRFQKERKSLPAIALTTDTSILTSLANDYGFETIFKRQIEGLGKEGDVAIGISTSGNSVNVIEAVKIAKKKGLKTISLTGNKGGKLADLTDINIDVPSSVTARVQEAHICVCHCICEIVEENLS